MKKNVTLTFFWEYLKDKWAKINCESFKWKQFNGRSLTHISPVHI